MAYQKCPECGVLAYARDRFSNGHYCFPSQGGCGVKFPAEIVSINGLFRHTIPANSFLKKNITAYFHNYYIPTKDGGGEFSNLILAIKSNGTEAVKLSISEIIAVDLDKILEISDGFLKTQPIVVAVPRSKPDSVWKSSELQFRPAISMGLAKSKYTVRGSVQKWMVDGTRYLIRILETQTTHLAHKNNPENTGPEPYPGITKDTCQLSGNISGKNIILVDDIYTDAKGIDEDCIQFLLDNGADNVILYTLGMTKRSTRDVSIRIPF